MENHGRVRLEHKLRQLGKALATQCCSGLHALRRTIRAQRARTPKRNLATTTRPRGSLQRLGRWCVIQQISHRLPTLINIPTIPNASETQNKTQSASQTRDPTVCE